MSWKTAAADEKLALVRDINKVEPAMRFNPDQTLVESLSLPFYPKAALLRFDKGQPRGGPLWYMKLQGEIVPLDGSVANIHYVNANAPLDLTAQTVAAYLKFRLYFADNLWLESALVETREEGFRAAARVTERAGEYEAVYDISARGEVEELKKEQTAPAGKPLPQSFDL
ncbi:MAG: hypothetical protein GC185_06825 [Alphaproteobacteria bacterium]|nr:hypothetical protein [Alphaproteobacteria bacterium]